MSISIDEKRASYTDGYCGIKKILLPLLFDTLYQTTQKIKAIHIAGTRTLVFCLSKPAKKKGITAYKSPKTQLYRKRIYWLLICLITYVMYNLNSIPGISDSKALTI